jgi:hypothetical protein
MLTVETPQLDPTLSWAPFVRAGLLRPYAAFEAWDAPSVNSSMYPPFPPTHPPTHTFQFNIADLALFHYRFLYRSGHHIWCETHMRIVIDLLKPRYEHYCRLLTTHQVPFRPVACGCGDIIVRF